MPCFGRTLSDVSMHLCVCIFKILALAFVIWHYALTAVSAMLSTQHISGDHYLLSANRSHFLFLFIFCSRTYYELQICRNYSDARLEIDFCYFWRMRKRWGIHVCMYVASALSQSQATQFGLPNVCRSRKWLMDATGNEFYTVVNNIFY